MGVGTNYYRECDIDGDIRVFDTLQVKNSGNRPHFMFRPLLHRARYTIIAYGKVQYIYTYTITWFITLRLFFFTHV